VESTKPYPTKAQLHYHNILKYSLVWPTSQVMEKIHASIVDRSDAQLLKNVQDSAEKAETEAAFDKSKAAELWASIHR
jgi:hypothetical protein